jgi:dihydrofolate reductase
MLALASGALHRAPTLALDPMLVTVALPSIGQDLHCLPGSLAGDLNPQRQELGMRNIVAGLFVSLDGVAEAPNRWVFPYMTDPVGQVVGAAMAASDTMLLGRRTYQEWAAYWPDKTADDDPYAEYINSVPKHVVSTTLQPPLDWRNSTLVAGNPRHHISNLKQQPGKDIAISGSISLVGWLLREGLLDELSLLVFPVVVGSGKHLFDGPDQVPLKLVQSQTFDNSVLWLRYARAAR